MSKKENPQKIGPQNDAFTPWEDLSPAGDDEIRKYQKDCLYNLQDYHHQDSDCKNCKYRETCITPK